MGLYDSAVRSFLGLHRGHRPLRKYLFPRLPDSLRMIEGEVEGVTLRLELSQELDFRYLLGEWDRKELAFLLDNCGPDSRFVDVGANIGFYSLFFSRRRPAARILAFEPDPYSRAKLVGNVGLNGVTNITVSPYALSESDEPRELIVNTGRNRGGSSLREPAAADGENGGRGGEAGERIAVECRTLAQALAEYGVDEVDAMKIDIEGFEYPVLKKFFEEASPALHPRALVVEFFEGSAGAEEGNPVELLLGRGYRLAGRTEYNYLLRRVG